MVVTDVIRRLLHRIGAFEPLDKVAKPAASAATSLVPYGTTAKDVLSGTWLGHPVHPLLPDVTIGAFTSALVLDLAGDERTDDAARTLVGVGLLSALPTAAAGLSDWSDTIGEERRLGFVHAASNTVALALFGLSYAARRSGRTAAGKSLGLLGAAATTVGAYIGGHLVYRYGLWVDRNAWTHGTEDWHVVLDASALVESMPAVVQAGDEEVLLVRRGGEIHAIGNTCGHAGGPLDEGELDGDCVRCPWHGSVFRLSDGHVVHGPATGHQTAYDVRVDGGKVSIRRR